MHTLVLRQALTLRKEDYSLFFDYLSSINLKELDVSFNDSVVDDDYLVRLASVCDSLDRLNIGGRCWQRPERKANEARSSEVVTTTTTTAGPPQVTTT